MFKIGLRKRAEVARPAVPQKPIQPVAEPLDPVRLMYDEIKASGGAIHEPYRDATRNWLYNLNFCEHLAMCKASWGAALGKAWEPLFASDIDMSALVRIVEDTAIEAQLRLLAARRLRGRSGWTADASPLMIVIEVFMPDGAEPAGLDAMFLSANLVHFLSYGGARTIVEGRDMAECRIAANLMSLAADLILAGAAKPRQGPRTPPPDRWPLIRLSILTPGGDYVLEGEEKDLIQRFPQVLVVLNQGAKIMNLMLERGRQSKQNAATAH